MSNINVILKLNGLNCLLFGALFGTHILRRYFKCLWFNITLGS